MAFTCVGFSRPNRTRFDVFLSFRGEDTRHSFTDHLYEALKRAGIRTFRDDDDIKRGSYLEPEIVKAIENSKASVIVLSENYAKSRWCLEELSLILEQKRTNNHFVLAVFYHVDPSDVRNQRGCFAIERSKWIEVDVNRWKSALTEAANLKGMVASGSETKFIADIVDTINNQQAMKLTSRLSNLTGVEIRAIYINSWLKDEPCNNVLAICGMGVLMHFVWMWLGSVRFGSRPTPRHSSVVRTGEPHTNDEDTRMIQLNIDDIMTSSHAILKCKNYQSEMHTSKYTNISK
ncbi:disease resistance protein RUN1-like [Helianthus annuus]|uniref:disease resistance protein RUN1-like n=1 Tax=Helianthus annuus TaxID=4232 RepID=UPI000B8EF4C3|nr:disease resistance protein RUN1-like [Helianthus annuus]